MTLGHCCDSDDELHRLRERRMAQLKKEAALETNLYGVLEPISHEKEVVHIISNSSKLVVHFKMPSFRRCDIMAQHLASLAKIYPKTKFIEVNAVDMPFLVAKFKVQVLPCLVVIAMGQVVDKYL
jgi:thioredoxin-like negative regulator of GroEL